MRKIAGAITTFARPKYYKQALDSLCKCKEVNKNIDWYIFQDGIENYPEKYVRYKTLTRKDVEKNIMVTLDSKFPYLHHFINKENKGINYQMNRVFGLFEKGYDVIFIFEDDLVVSPYYIKLLKQCSKQYKNMSVTFHSVTEGKLNKGKNLHRLRPAKRPRFWGFYLTKEVWKKIQPTWKQFYRKRRIRFPYYDPTLTQAIRKFTDGKYEPLVSRSYNVGVEGTLTMSESNWGGRGLEDQTKKIAFERDNTLNRFELDK